MVLRRRRRLLSALICLSSHALAQEPPATPPPQAPAVERAEVVKPVPISTPAPLYPEGAHGDHAVIVELTVTAEGNVAEPKVVSGETPFAELALEACSRWTFRPAEVQGKPAPARIRFEVLFKEPLPPAPAAEPEPAPAAKPSAAPPPAPKPPVEEPIEVVVLGVRPAPDRASLTRAEVREMPGTFGDPFRAIEVLPGVTPLVTGVPYFYVRGSPPGNVGYFLDGIRVPLLYHFALGPSVIHPGLVERVDLYSGGYPARYGRFSGGIVTAETTPPRPDFHGEANIRLFDAGAMLEAPLGGGRGAALAGGRYSYTGGILSLVAPEVTLGYWDYQLRVSHDVGTKDRIGAFAFGSYDYFSVETGGNDEGLSTEFHRLDLRHERRVSAGTLVKSAMTLGYERSLNSDDVFVASQMLGLRSSVETRTSQQALFRAGVDVEANNYSAELGSDAEARRALPSRVDSALGVWGDFVLEPDPWVTVTPGLRVDAYASDGASAVGVDPRLSARFQVSRRVAIEHAFGIVHQTPSFVVPIPGFALGGLRGGLQRAFQTSSGVDVDLPAGFTSKLTLFQNAMFNLSDLLSLVRAENQVNDLNLDTRMRGHAYGLEFSLRRALTEKLGGYFAYTLSRSVRYVDGVSVVASFDRTHVLHAALAYDLGKHWRAGGRFTFYTGAPPELDTGEFAGIPGQAAAATGIHEERSPDFYRVDVRLEKKWLIGKKGAWVSFIFEVLNTTLHKEYFGWRCTPSGCRGDEFGPVTIPSIGGEAAF